MNLPDLTPMRKEGAKTALLIGLVLIVGAGSFLLGRLSTSSSSQGAEYIVGASTEVASVSSLSSTSVKETEHGAKEGGVVASKTGTKYYFPWCGSAQNISDGNKIWFQTTKEARAAGYLPASNCKGLQ